MRVVKGAEGRSAVDGADAGEGWRVGGGPEKRAGGGVGPGFACEGPWGRRGPWTGWGGGGFRGEDGVVAARGA